MDILETILGSAMIWPFALAGIIFNVGIFFIKKPVIRNIILGFSILLDIYVLIISILEGADFIEISIFLCVLVIVNSVAFLPKKGGNE